MGRVDKTRLAGRSRWETTGRIRQAGQGRLGRVDKKLGRVDKKLGRVDKTGLAGHGRWDTTGRISHAGQGRGDRAGWEG